MSLNQLMPEIQALSTLDKLHLLKLLAEALTEENLHEPHPGLPYPVWTPYNAFPAADTLLEALAADRKAADGSERPLL